MKLRKTVLVLMLGTAFSCSVKNNQTIPNEPQSGIHGSWQEFRHGIAFDSFQHYSGSDGGRLWTLTSKELLDSTVYPAHVFRYSYKLKDSIIDSKFRDYKIMYLSNDTLIVREREYEGQNEQLKYDYYFFRVLKHTF